jgi:hypothetical protein
VVHVDPLLPECRRAAVERTITELARGLGFDDLQVSATYAPDTARWHIYALDGSWAEVSDPLLLAAVDKALRALGP